MNLYLVNENITNGFHTFNLTSLTIAAILCSIFVIVSKNPIVSVLFLIALFFSISIYLMLLGLNFIGLSYLLVYVGAVSILFLFILMLINIRISEISSTTSNSIPLAIIIGTLFFSTLYQALPLTIQRSLYNKNEYDTILPSISIIKGEITNYLYNIYHLLSTVVPSSPNFHLISKHNRPLSLYNNENLDYVSSQPWDTMLAEYSHINTLGNILYTSFPLWILLTSLILLLAMVGAIVVTVKN